MLSWFSQVSAAGSWPEWFMLNLMALLGKASGGARTVGKTPMFYRAWVSVNKHVANEWDPELPAWDACRPGTSALGAAMLRASKAEHAALAGDAVAACLWDFAKFFDTIPHGILHTEVQHAHPYGVYTL